VFDASSFSEPSPDVRLKERNPARAELLRDPVHAAGRDEHDAASRWHGVLDRPLSRAMTPAGGEQLRITDARKVFPNM
jgi:hypothetical protein